jgi:hypothetical protein
MAHLQCNDAAAIQSHSRLLQWQEEEKSAARRNTTAYNSPALRDPQPRAGLTASKHSVFTNPSLVAVHAQSISSVFLPSEGRA